MKKITAALLATVMAMSLAACGNGGETKETETKPAAESTQGTEGTESAEAPTGELTTVNVAYMPDYASLNGVISAQQLGYFEDEGLEVNLIQFSDPCTAHP